MAKIVFILIMAVLYVCGVRAFSERALSAEQHLAGFYTATSDPDNLLSISSTQDGPTH